MKMALSKTEPNIAELIAKKKELHPALIQELVALSLFILIFKQTRKPSKKFLGDRCEIKKV